VKISSINGGPAGLYFALPMNKLDSHYDAIEQSFAHWDDIELLKGQRP
jgi:hypothetical protein